MLARVELVPEATHRSADGRQRLVIHRELRWHCHLCARLVLLGDRACAAALWLNDVANLARGRLGLPYFEHAVSRAAQMRGVEGVVRGHIHNPRMKTINGVLYCNDGDRVESCTALVEDARGWVEIVEWTRFACERNRAVQAGSKPSIPAQAQPVAA